MADRPAAEFEIDEALVRSLVVSQAPDFADLPLELVAAGWDNEIWKLGADHAIRLPRRSLAESLVQHEQRWLPELAPRLPVAVPVPVVAGRPTDAYPRAWSIVEWFPGEPLGPVGGDDAFADRLAAFLQALHQPAPDDAPVNDWRGVPLADRADRAETALSTVGQAVGSVTADRLRRRWERLVATPTHVGPAVWLHGDLHPLNILVEDGALTAVIDFGDLTSGDPASDLAVAWMAFETPQRRRFQAALAPVDANTWARAQGWALLIGAMVVVQSDDDPVLEASARVTLERVLDDDIPTDDIPTDDTPTDDGAGSS